MKHLNPTQLDLFHVSWIALGWVNLCTSLLMSFNKLQFKFFFCFDSMKIITIFGLNKYGCNLQGSLTRVKACEKDRIVHSTYASTHTVKRKK